MIRNERYVLRSQQGYLGEDGFVEDPHKAIKRVTIEGICEVNKAYLEMIDPIKQMFSDDSLIVFQIQAIQVPFPSPEKHEPLSRI